MVTGEKHERENMGAFPKWMAALTASWFPGKEERERKRGKKGAFHVEGGVDRLVVPWEGERESLPCGGRR